MNVGLSYVQGFCILKIFSNILLAYLWSRCALFPGTIDYFVVNICKVLDKLHLISSVFKIVSKCVKYDKRSCIPDVEKVVYGRSANIYADLAFLNRHKFFLLPCQCIIYLHFAPPLLPLQHLLPYIQVLQVVILKI